MQETWVQSLVQEDPLEKEIETHSSILAWRIPWTEEPHKELDMTEWLTHTPCNSSHCAIISLSFLYLFVVYTHRGEKKYLRMSQLLTIYQNE